MFESQELAVRFDEFDRITSERGWNTDTERAPHLGVSRATISSLRAGRTRPGQRFVGGVTDALGEDAAKQIFETRPRNSARGSTAIGEPLMTITQLAKRMGVGRTTAYEIAVVSRRMDWIDIGTGRTPRIRVSESAYQRYLESRKVSASA